MADALLAGWGRTSPSRARVLRPGSVDELAAAVREAGRRGVIARGLGRSYGDPAQNGGGVVVDLTRLRRFDLIGDRLIAEGGASLGELIRTLASRGRFLPVVPGTRHVTVGGAVAADVHGKNHPADGSFAAHVEELDLLTADGTIRTVRPGEAAFHATTGGMGLTGVVTRATLRPIPIGSPLMRVETRRCGDLDDVLACLSGSTARYAVAWLDCLSERGRGIVDQAVHTEGRVATAALQRPLLSVPPHMPGGLLNRHTAALFNHLWYGKAPRASVRSMPLGAYFHPLDRIRDWNRIYGPAGFVQYQFAVPYGEGLKSVVRRIARSGVPSFLAVLKRLGPAGEGLLSFPIEGWTLALDFPAAAPGLPELLDACDQAVIAAGGRVYLAKDARLAPESMPAMYPGLARFREVRALLDPAGVFQSDLARRLRL
ncbi:oxidoreductase [Acrocarpospora pleiomorpha]|uniref:Oxidoreductase n=1 Tax=Acrocarpospora pleiomorpha TaxID=90975 RepID=A0A5M3XIQ5_9ACTN|nr:FAD-binding oxidoreductase [Acrocarpospora pleiomorpha]GES19561.1 oxidoreductase [Acrocarpospora pleiomorpha]